MPDAPHISVVVTARNDGHGGNMLGRMQAFLDSWIVQSKRYELASEIIVVEWNPPAGRGKLMDELHWPVGTEPCEVRFIEVPAEIHEQFPNAAVIPLHQMIAKNVGIRRARGEFVLATNLDIVFSRDLMQFLALRSLERGKLYRIDRHDVSTEIPIAAPLDELLSYCDTHKLRVFTKTGRFTFDNNGLWKPDQKDIVKADAGIHLQRGWHPSELGSGGPYRWMEPEVELVLQRPGPRLLIDLETGPSAGGKPIEIEIVRGDGAVLGSIALNGRSLLQLHLPDPMTSCTLRFQSHGISTPLASEVRFLNLRAFELRWEHSRSAPKHGLEVLKKKRSIDWTRNEPAFSQFARKIRRAAFLHTNASGDFTLLSRDEWFALRGYAEFPIWPMHIDSLLCYTAYHAGIEEAILHEPMRIFHIEHLSGAGWTPEGENERLDRIEKKQVDAISNMDVIQWVETMRRFDRPMIFNTCDWGLAGTQLAETSPHRR